MPVYQSNGEGVLFLHKFVGPLLTLASEVAIGELVAVEGGGRGRRLMWTSLGARPVAALTEGVFWCLLQTMANICAVVWHP